MARNKALANLPWHIDEDQSQRGNITIKDRNGKTVCRVPFDSPARGEAGTADDHDRAMLIVEAVRAYAETLTSYTRDSRQADTKVYRR